MMLRSIGVLQPDSLTSIQPLRLSFLLLGFLFSLVIRIEPGTCFSMSASASSSRNNPPPLDGQGRPHVVVVGSANQDLTAYTNVVPVLGQTVLGQCFETGCGGKGANQARAAASLVEGGRGNSAAGAVVTLICRTGDDVFGESLRTQLRQVGIHLDEATTVLSTTSSGVASIIVDTQSGDNMIVVTPGANHQLEPEHVRHELLQMVQPTQARPPSVVLVQLEILYETALEALQVGKELGAMTILNPAPAPEDPSLLDQFWSHTDVLIPNESELRVLCGKHQADESCNEEELAQSLLTKGVGKAVIVTLGARGAMIVEPNGITTMVSAPKDLTGQDDPVIDTIGAGDGFCGSLATYLAAGLQLHDAAHLACGFAGMSVRRRGVSYPTYDELPPHLRIQSLPSSNPDQIPMRKPTLTFVTGNVNKLKEVQKILNAVDNLPFDIVNQKVDLPELQGDDPVTIAREKCRLAMQQVKGPCFIEDTSLCFNALNGMPGPYIKWFLDKCGHDGLNQMLAGFDDKTAYAETIVAFANGTSKTGSKEEEDIHIFVGRTDGTIVPPRGSLEFGWDPIFETLTADGVMQTYAEMTKPDKNAVSHRGKAFEQFRAYLTAQLR